MRYLIFLFLTGCTLTAQQQNAEQQKDAEFNKLIDNAKQNQSTFKKVQGLLLCVGYIGWTRSIKSYY